MNAATEISRALRQGADGPSGDAEGPPHETRYVSKEDDPTSSHSVILETVGAGVGRRLLDVGSADGFLAQRFTERGYEVTCLEADPTLAARAASRCHRVVQVDLDTQVPTLSGRYDVMVFADVLEHLRRPDALLRTLLPALAPDGRLVVSVPNVAHLWIRASLLLGRFEYADRGILDRTHMRFFTLRTFRAFLRDAGLRVEALVATPAPLPLVVPGSWRGRWLGGVQRIHARAARAWKGGLAYQFVATCRVARSA